MNQEQPARSRGFTALFRYGKSRADGVTPKRRGVVAAGPPDATPSAGAPAAAAGQGTAAELNHLRTELAHKKERLASLEAEHAQLLEERRALQRELGSRQGKSTLPRLKVEKTNGSPSLTIGVRMMQRIFRGAEEYDQPIDDVAAVLANPAGLRGFATSHGVPTATDGEAGADSEVIVHAFQGTVGLVEIHRDGKLRHLEPDGADPGEIRPDFPYDVTIEVSGGFEEICRHSATLSAHVPRPYVQVHWRSGEAPVVTRIDIDPDRLPVLVPEWDVRLGRLFDTGHARMLLPAYRAGALDNRIPGSTFSPESQR